MTNSVKLGLSVVLLAIVVKLLILFSHTQLTATGMMSNLAVILFLFPAVFFAIKWKRDKELGGFMNFRQALKEGLATTVIAAVGIAVFAYVYFEFIDKEIADQVIQMTKEQGIKLKKTDKEINDFSTQLLASYTGSRQATSALSVAMVLGLLYTFISASFLVRIPPNSSEN